MRHKNFDGGPIEPSGLSGGGTRSHPGGPGRSSGEQVPTDGDPVALIDALYTLSDITAEINGQTELECVGLVDPNDVGLIDDLIDALQDARYGGYARDVLREAVAQIARRALSDQG